MMRLTSSSTMSTRAIKGLNSSIYSPARIIPVVAAEFPAIPDFGQDHAGTKCATMVQCIIRDTTRHRQSRDYYLIEGTLGAGRSTTS